MLLPLLLGLYVPQTPYLIPLSQKVNNTIVLGLLIVMIFPAVVEFNNYRWGRHVERNIPRLLRDVSEAVRAGVTLPKTLEDAAQRNYGPISKELEHAISMFVLGASWEEAMMSLARRLKRPSALRLATIFIEANQTGGKMVEVLEASVNLFSSLDEFREEQYNNMKPYLLTIYMATVIFLIIAYVVLHQFLGPLYAATTAVVGAQESGLLPNILDINYYASILFWASVMEAVFGGLIAGKIGDRSLSAGMRHSAVLVATAVIFFNFAGA
ncbi:MAG TPA: type II secretion system F family protein [Candidatus Bathyarchaeia archaeon]|nr:type II secretion system F family protein [Candidatus Bathyarchaeia archaeon]